jgi:hypothetical protein
MRLLAALLAIGAALPARAEGGDVVPPALRAAAPNPDLDDARAAGLPLPTPPRSTLPPEATDDAHRRWGLLVDAGFPEGASVSAVSRPVSQLRFWAGPSYNVVAYGAQGGLAFVPWALGVSPVFSVEGGRYFSPDASFIARRADEIPDELEPLLEDVKYDYAAAHVGVEIGTRDGFALSLRAGLAYVSLRARGRATATSDDGTTTVTFADPRIRGTIPSLKLGLQLWF